MTNPMNIAGMDHVTINVISMEDSIQFYEEILGLKKGDQVNMGDHFIQYFFIHPTLKLELIKYNYETENVEVEVDCSGIYRHIALLVTDLEHYSVYLKEKKVPITMDLSFCEKLDFHNMLITDPNGVEIELVEYQKA